MANADALYHERSMIAIGVVSDTHLPRFGRALPRSLVAGLTAANVTRIFHCGDHTEGFVTDLLATIAPVEAVAGNNDGAELTQRWGTRRIVKLAGAAIGLVHGHAGPGGTTPERAHAAFAGERVDAICFGHSHQPHIERRGGVLLLNPGSPTDRRREAQFSYALLYVDGRALRAELRRFGGS